MKKYLFIIVLLSLASCYEQQRDCKDFKTGKFKSEIETKNGKMTMDFERSDSLEIGTYNGKTDTATVRWVNDCEYVTQKINPKSMAEKKAIAVRILTTSKNSYTFEFGEVGSDAKQTGTVTKIN